MTEPLFRIFKSYDYSNIIELYTASQDGLYMLAAHELGVNIEDLEDALIDKDYANVKFDENDYYYIV